MQSAHGLKQLTQIVIGAKLAKIPHKECGVDHSVGKRNHFISFATNHHLHKVSIT